MESDLWRGFVAVAEHRNFTNAAATLSISQSGLSQQIRRLEGLLGVSLFERTTREVRLSEVGAELLTAARAYLSAEQELLERVVAWRRSDETSRVLTVFVMENGIGHLLIDIVEQARRLIPGLRVEIEQVGLPEQSAVLSTAFEASVLIGRPPFAPALEGARRTRLADDVLCLVVPNDDPIGQVISVDEAVSIDRRSLPWLPQEWKRWTPLFAETERHPTDVMVANNFKNAIQSVGIDARPCVVPRSIADSYLVASEARIVAITDAPAGSIELISTSDDELVDLFHTAAAARVAGGSVVPKTTAIQ